MADNKPAKQNKSKIPSRAELTANIEEAYKSDALNYRLNQPPIESWIKEHPFITGHKYIPIDKIELMMRRIFKDWQVEIKDTSHMFNSVYVTVRIHYIHPPTGEWRYHDGIGATPLQLESGAEAADLASIKKSAVAMALPTAKSQAIKDAVDHLGRLFGGDLNREDLAQFAPDNELSEMVRNKEMSPKEFEHALQAVKEGNNDLKFLEKYYSLSEDQRNEIKKAEQQSQNNKET